MPHLLPIVSTKGKESTNLTPQHVRTIFTTDQLKSISSIVLKLQNNKFRMVKNKYIVG